QAQRATDKTGHAQPDPLPAILDFQRQLKARGIELLVMPIPAKPTIHPEMLSRRSESGDLPNNPSYRAFIAALREQNIAVFDPTEFLLQRKQSSGRAQYWPADTHWTPDAMESVARLLARRVQTEYSFAAPPNAGYHREARTVTNLSDIAIMLKLPKWQQLYPRHTAQIHPVYDRYGQLWKSRRRSEILFLGDSFSNIYSRGGYWGESAGLVEQLSYHLQRPIARIGVDGGGAVVTRWQLASLMRAALHHPGERGPLQGKKLVIYEFAA